MAKVTKTEVILASSTEATETPSLSETEQSEIVDAIQEKIIIQPIIQPIQTQTVELLIPQFQTFTADPQFEEIATYAETWNWENVAKPIIAKGVTVYNDNIPANIVRPREYCVFTADDEVRDINFAGNKNFDEESLCTWVIQGNGNTFENWVVEISKFIHELLRGFRKQGKIHSTTNRKVGFDETTNILSRTITFWLYF